MEIHKIDVRWLLTQTGSFVIFFINNLSIQQHPWKLRNTRDCLKEITCNFKNSNLLSYRKTLLQKKKKIEAVMNTISGILPFFPFSSDLRSATLLIEMEQGLSVVLCRKWRGQEGWFFLGVWTH